MPCADDVCAIKNEKAKTELSASGSQQEKDHNDSCSPFCICNCCAGFSVNHSLASVNILDFASCRNFASYLPENIVEISLPVWEPPRI